MRGSGVSTIKILFSLCLLALHGSTIHALPVGSELTVSSQPDDPATTADNDQEAPDVAMDAQGNFAIVFQRDTPGDHIIVAARLYEPHGIPRGPEFRINTTGPNDRMAPQVAMHATGDFVVVWADNFADRNSDGVMARYYLANGEPRERFDEEGGSLGRNNFQVNSSTQGQQHRTAVAMAESGTVVIVWEDSRFADFKRRIRGRIYSVQGYPLSDELAISEDTSIDHSWPRVAVDGQGNFAVVWESGNVGRNTDLALRRFDALGNPLGNRVLVNLTSRVSHASGVHRQSDIAMDAAGNGIVLWRADNFSGPGIVGRSIGILARRFDAAGQLGEEVATVDSERASFLNHPSIAMNAQGEFAIAYEASDDSLSGIRVRQYYDDGTLRGRPAQANTFETLIQSRPAVALGVQAHAVASWQSSNQDEAGKGVFARRLTGLSARPTVDFNRDGIGDIAARNTVDGMNAILTLDHAGLREVQTFNQIPDPRWQNVAQADFDCDGYTDFFWRNQSSGENAVLLMQEFAIREVIFAPAVIDTGWQVAGAGHFERDCYGDILWRHETSGEWLVWLVSEQGLSSRSVLRPGTDWQIAAIADFNRDRRADILARSSAGSNAIVLMNGSAISDIRLIDAITDTSWQIVDADDFDGDGKADIFWRNSISGQNVLALMDIFTLRNEQFIEAFRDPLWQVVGVRDTNGDRRPDLLWHHQGNGSLRRMTLDGFSITATQTIVAASDPNWHMVR